MSGVIRWEDPPARGGRDVYDWPCIAADLKSRPGAWALVVVCPNASTAGQTARHIRDGNYEPLGNGFEATARTIGDEARVYARWVGEPS